MLPQAPKTFYRVVSQIPEWALYILYAERLYVCGIIGYSGKGGNAIELVVEGLKRLEYRGYDSFGYAWLEGKQVKTKKQVGEISRFAAREGETKTAMVNTAIGHTRWATHGGVEERNAHPHLSKSGEIAVVHNGIIENHAELKSFLKGKGFEFGSETDTEAIPHLIEHLINEGNDYESAVRKALQQLKGRFAVLVLSSSNSKIIAARSGSPLVIGLGEKGNFIASDIPAFLKHTKKVVFMEDGDVAVIDENVRLLSLKGGSPIERETQHIDWDFEQAEKGGYDHFMIKEILEQKETLLRAVSQGNGVIGKVASMINDSFGTYMVGCGTAGKVCLAGTYLFARIAKKHVNFAFGSEFPSYHHFIKPNSLLIAVSQSGETADTLEAIEAAKSKGAKVVSVLNAIGSTMQRQSDVTIPINAGPEICVASTKATTAQIAVLTMLAYACDNRPAEGKELLEETAEKISEMLTEEYLSKVRDVACKLKDMESMYIIGRGLNYPIALESSIKLQEVSYIHAEGFAAGELKHGPIALIGRGTACIAIVANDETKQDVISNVTEVKSRGGMIIGISPENNDVFDTWLKVPDCGDASPIANIIPVQLISYCLAVLRGNNPDKPRNLAKSVTVK